MIEENSSLKLDLGIKPKIKILVTGGTFDKVYNELLGNLHFKHSHVPEMLNISRCSLDTNVNSVLLIDSLDMNSFHRDLIYQNCLNSQEDKILITHGTDTMPETAMYLDNRIKDKTIVLTGAMVPFSFGKSDSLFNLGSALAFLQLLPKGVYIAMNGKVFHAKDVKKNKEIGLFQETK